MHKNYDTGKIRRWDMCNRITKGIKHEINILRKKHVLFQHQTLVNGDLQFIIPKNTLYYGISITCTGNITKKNFYALEIEVQMGTDDYVEKNSLFNHALLDNTIWNNNDPEAHIVFNQRGLLAKDEDGSIISNLVLKSEDTYVTVKKKDGVSLKNIKLNGFKCLCNISPKEILDIISRKYITVIVSSILNIYDPFCKKNSKLCKYTDTYDIYELYIFTNIGAVVYDVYVLCEFDKYFLEFLCSYELDGLICHVFSCDMFVKYYGKNDCRNNLVIHSKLCEVKKILCAIYEYRW